MRAALTVALAMLALVGPARGEALDALEGLLPDYLLAGLEDLVKAASDACDMLPLDAIIRRGRAAGGSLDVVQVTRASRRVLRLARAHLALPAPPAPFTLYIPGWWNTPTDEAAQALSAALLQDQPFLLILDTRLSFCRGYLSAAARVDAVAHLLYDFIRNLAERGHPPSSVHLIGFSLGAHVAGTTGKLVRRGLGTRLGRITALDPAKPCFRTSERRLRRSDAAFVHVLHSSAGVLGLAEPLGHADVYVNGLARGQPECAHRRVRLECDHNAAWRVFARSARGDGLPARRCAAWRDLAAARCAGPPADLGYGCSNSSRGMFLYMSDPTTTDE